MFFAGTFKPWEWWSRNNDFHIKHNLKEQYIFFLVCYTLLNQFVWTWIRVSEREKSKSLFNWHTLTTTICVDTAQKWDKLFIQIWLNIKTNDATHISRSDENIKRFLESRKKVEVKSLSCVRLFATPWTVAHQVPPSMGFFRQEYWSGLPFPSPGESSRPRDRTQVSRISGRHFNLWATRETEQVLKQLGKWLERKQGWVTAVEFCDG